VNGNLINVGMRSPLEREGHAPTKILRNPVRNRIFNAFFFPSGRNNATYRSPSNCYAKRILGINTRTSCRMVGGILTLSCLDISSVRQVSLHTDDNVPEIWETEGGQEVVRDALFEQNRRVGGEFWACRERCGEGGGIVVPCGMRDDVSGPSQGKRHGRQNRSEMQEAHGRVLNVRHEQLGRGTSTFVGCWPGFEFQAFKL
jgi:hypothetical protein